MGAARLELVATEGQKKAVRDGFKTSEVIKYQLVTRFCREKEQKTSKVVGVVKWKRTKKAVG